MNHTFIVLKLSKKLFFKYNRLTTISNTKYRIQMTSILERTKGISQSYIIQMN